VVQERKLSDSENGTTGQNHPRRSFDDSRVGRTCGIAERTSDVMREERKPTRCNKLYSRCTVTGT